MIYFDKPCKKGHPSGRYVKNNRCVQCHAEYRISNAPLIKERNKIYREINKEKNRRAWKKWYSENSDNHKEKTKKYYQENKKSCSDVKKKWTEKHKDSILRKLKKWKAKNPEKARLHLKASSHKRRSRKIANGGSFTAKEIKNLHITQKEKCAICRGGISQKYHIDHILPLALGGGNDIKNIQILCRRCNLSKGAKHPITFMQERGFLL